jgi:hypothetical protein
MRQPYMASSYPGVYSLWIMFVRGDIRRDNVCPWRLFAGIIIVRGIFAGIMFVRGDYSPG